MNDLTRLLEEGKLDIFVILALLLALVWVVRQWRQAEKDKDQLHKDRLEDTKVMYVLATEVKNVVSALVQSTGEK